MDKKVIYLDHAATTATRPEVVEAMLPFFTENYGNPSSVYEFASQNKSAVDEAREVIAKSLGTDAKEIYFTAGGSESDNWALKETAEAYKDKGNHIITSKIEHHAILHTCEYLEKQGCEVTYIDVDAFHYGNNSVNLTEIFIHNSISHLGMGCFENYGRMDGFTINDGSGLINSENYSTYFGVRNAPTITGIDSH